MPCPGCIGRHGGAINSMADSPGVTQPDRYTLFAVDGDLRPVSRRELNGYAIGALQVFIDGTFGTVCGASFSNVIADVACRQLGFAGGGISPFADETLTQAELQVYPCTQDVLPSVTYVHCVFHTL